MLVYRLQVLALKVVLEVDPAVPGFVERQAKYLLELIGVIAATAGVTAPPSEQPLRSIGDGQVVHEARAIEISVRAGLEVDLGALGYQSQRVIELRAVLHHRAEHHLVVAAL